MNVRKVVLQSLLCAICVAGSLISFPIFGSRCAPIQHVVNVLAAVILGPFSGVLIAFVASILRNIFGLGSILAFPGSMIGALFAGLLYQKTKKIRWACIGEVFGTGIIGGFVAYPIALLLMGKIAGELSFYVYVIPFLLSTIAGTIIARMVLLLLQKTNRLEEWKNHEGSNDRINTK